MKICVIGLWHQGIVGAACLADLGCSVVAADHDAKRIALLNSGKAPLFEPGLDELIEKGLRSGKLAFSSDVAGSVKGCPYVLIMFDTPVNERDESDLSEVLATAAEIAPQVGKRRGSLCYGAGPGGDMRPDCAKRPRKQPFTKLWDRVQPGESPTRPGDRSISASCFCRSLAPTIRRHLIALSRFSRCLT